MHTEIDILKTRANHARYSYIEEMEKHLLDFESSLTAKNFSVRWISDEKELVEFVMKNMSKNNYNKVCFDIPHIPEKFFENRNFIKEITVEQFETNKEHAENLIVQADFGIVKTGSIALVNKQSKNCFNSAEKIFIILNINSLVIRKKEFELLLALTSEPLTQSISDIKIISSPPSRIVNKKFQHSTEENYTLEKIEVFVLLYDNGITEILQDNLLREALFCINCGKCKEVCPVYKQSKQFSPIELVKYHCQEANRKTPQIFENTTLCGNCNEVCPVQINFTQLLTYQMQNLPKRQQHEKNIDLQRIFMKRAKMNKINSRLRRYFFIKKYYGNNKKLAAYYSSNKEQFFNNTL